MKVLSKYTLAIFSPFLQLWLLMCTQATKKIHASGLTWYYYFCLIFFFNFRNNSMRRIEIYGKLVKKIKLMTSWGTHPRASVPEGLHPGEGCMPRQFLKCGLWEGVTLEKFMEDFACGREPCLSRGRTPAPDEKVPETTCEELSINPISCLLDT